MFFLFLFLAWTYFSGGLNYQTERNSRSNALQISSLRRPLQFLLKKFNDNVHLLLNGKCMNNN
jgi:hypothetical protein